MITHKVPYLKHSEREFKNWCHAIGYTKFTVIKHIYNKTGVHIEAIVTRSIDHWYLAKADQVGELVKYELLTEESHYGTQATAKEHYKKLEGVYTP
jgi:hypothetical protein